MKSGNLYFLEPSGTLQDCNGTALPLLLPLPFVYLQELISETYKTWMISGLRGLSMWVLFSSNQPYRGRLVPMFRRPIPLPLSKRFRRSMITLHYNFLLHMSRLGKYVFLQDIWLLSRERTSVGIHWVGPWAGLYIRRRKSSVDPTGIQIPDLPARIVVFDTLFETAV